MIKNISLLGSTGSIGTQTLEVARMHGFSICALAAHSNVKLLEEQIREFRPALAAVFDEHAAQDLKDRVRDLPVRVVSGMDGLCEAASIKEADIICNAVVGMVGLLPTMAAVSAKKDVALANKETLVAGGALVMKAAQENGVRILPVDSEHSAIFQCLQGCPHPSAVAKLILTASGGPFFGKSRKELELVTPEQALRHPNWSMGAKVTIDSATMMNKGLEIIEASWLFSMPVSQIEVVVHRESIVHSLIEYQDYSVLAQLGVPDMRIAIQYAITWPERLPSPVKRLSLTEMGTLSFYPPDEHAFPCLGLAKQAIQQGGLVPAAMNGANEEAVKLFLSKKISFLQIPELVEAAMKRQAPELPTTPQQVLAADQNARNFVLDKTKS